MPFPSGGIAHCKETSYFCEEAKDDTTFQHHWHHVSFIENQICITSQELIIRWGWDIKPDLANVNVMQLVKNGLWPLFSSEISVGLNELLRTSNWTHRLQKFPLELSSCYPNFEQETHFTHISEAGNHHQVYRLECCRSWHLLKQDEQVGGV
jgi:hypothetical protein